MVLTHQRNNISLVIFYSPFNLFFPLAQYVYMHIEITVESTLARQSEGHPRLTFHSNLKYSIPSQVSNSLCCRLRADFLQNRLFGLIFYLLSLLPEIHLAGQPPDGAT
ncbi:hypothetical protein Taro_030609 [Colocasia esculenta]|uniref:Uncharacterized protein n=1 Tax=Colocasia esculenta TaxID=4460 RepID=A0A843W0Q2_COLES|nr:hypothetical protein [Colocasia esculenta]